MSQPLPPSVLDLLQLQHGVISRSQALSELNGSGLRRQLDGGRWERLGPGVYGVVGHRHTWVRRLWTAHLYAGPDSAVSHESAGRLRGHAEVPAGKVVLSTARSIRRPNPLGTFIRTDDLAEDDVEDIDGLPVTTPARTVIDLASVFRPGRLRLVAEAIAIEDPAALAEMGSILHRVRRSGKPGVKRMEQVLDRLGPGNGIGRSELERLTLRVVDLAGLPAPLLQHPLPNARGRVGFVDFCWEEARLILEADGRKWHAREQQMLADADRMLEAQALGYDTARLLWEHAAHDPDGSAALVRQIYERRLALHAGAIVRR